MGGFEFFLYFHCSYNYVLGGGKEIRGDKKEKSVVGFGNFM